MHVSELDTPALLIDLDIMERNLERVADYAREHGLRLRPHTKTHKIPALARRQLDLGAAGLTVAKVGEAEVMLNAAPHDLLLAYPVIGERKLQRLMCVAKRTEVTVSLDNLVCARQLSEAAQSTGVEIGVLAEFDAGMGRVGVVPGEELNGLVKGILGLPKLRFEGVAFYPGHIKKTDEEEGLGAIEKLSETLDCVHAGLRSLGVAAKVVSGGSTPTLFHSHLVRGMNEIRPGTYIFNDKNTVFSGACTYEDCAASILTTVVSTAHRGQVLIDGGSKTFSSDRLGASPEVSFGHVVEAPGAVFTKMNEEHGYVDITKAERGFEIGDRVHVIPNHICVAMNLHETVYGVRGGMVEQVWRVEARGKLQ